MKPRIFTIFLVLLALGDGLAQDLSRPNILIIFTDDQGYADLGCFGSKENQTPVLDKLAREGTKFTSFYAQPVCGPSRSALLTGRYPVRSKGWSMPASEITFAEMLKEIGYQTACVGKWDVSNRKAIVERMPNAQGFDYSFGHMGGCIDNYSHFFYWQGPNRHDLHKNGRNFPPNFLHESWMDYLYWDIELEP